MTAEILKVISQSPANVQPVFDAVAERPGLLCHAEMSRVWLMNGDELRAMTTYGRGIRPIPAAKRFRCAGPPSAVAPRSSGE